MLSWLFGKKKNGVSSSELYRLDGDETFEQEIVGESHYQEALEQIAGPKDREGKEYYCDAILVCELDNPHDPNAVAVNIEGFKVGHLSRNEAVIWRKSLEKQFGGLPNIEVDTVIVGGWVNRRGEGHFGVKLDIG